MRRHLAGQRRIGRDRKKDQPRPAGRVARYADGEDIIERSLVYGSSSEKIQHPIQEESCRKGYVPAAAGPEGGHTSQWLRRFSPSAPLDSDAAGEFSSQIHSHLVFCPACRKIQDRFPGGELTLRGVEAGNRGEIARILRNEEARAREKNPLERIMCMDAANGRWRVEATTEKLAQRLGRSLRRQGVESSVTRGGIIISSSVWSGKRAGPAGLNKGEHKDV